MNYLCFGGRFRIKYAYVDVNRDCDYLADALFFKREIPVYFKDEMVRAGDKYRVIFCSIKKKYQKKFEEALNELRNKMVICGFTDYDEYCENLKKELEDA